MDIELEHLALLPELLKKLEIIDKKLSAQKSDEIAKRWLTTKELAQYLSYSLDSIYRLKEDSLIEGVHFYKREGKILFDRVAIDDWVVSKEKTHETNRTKQQIVDRLLLSVKEV